MTAPKRRAAARPKPREISVTLDAPFEGWTATLRADFPLRVLADLGSGDVDRVGPGMDRLVIEHNFPNDKDEIAASMLDVDREAVEQLTEKLIEGLGKLPPR